MAKLWVCNLCSSDAEPFKVPVDKVGLALMQGHLESDHGEKQRKADFVWQPEIEQTLDVGV